MTSRVAAAPSLLHTSMSRHSSAAVSADIRQLLSAYASLSVTPPSSSRDRFISPRLKKLRSATRPSERASLALQMADRSFTRGDYDAALTFYTASLTAALASSSLDPAHLITLLRRLGEVQHALCQYSAAIATFHAALSLLPLLPSSTSRRERLHLPQTVHLSLGNSFLHWADDDDIPLATGHERVTEAVHWHRKSVQEAQQIAELKRNKAGAGGRSSGVSSQDALVLIGAYVNLGNTVVQQLHFDHYELRARHRGTNSDAINDAIPLPLSSFFPSSSATVDPLTAPVDPSLSSLTLSELSEHRRQRFLAASCLFDAALALAVSYDKFEEQLMVWDNSVGLYEAVGDFDRASGCIDKAEEAVAATGAVGYEWRVKRMTMWMRAERWTEALREATRLRETIEQRNVEGVTREVVEEGRQAMLDVDWVEAMWAKVQRKQRLQADVRQLSRPLEADSEGASREEESEEAEEARLRAHMSTLHALVQVCLSLAASNVGLHLHYATALDAHQSALALLLTTGRPFPRLSLCAHSFHVHTLVRYLPWLVRMKRDSAEVHDIVERGEQSMQAARAALAEGGAGPAGGEEETRVKGLLAWLEGQLRLQCGGAAKEVMAALQGGLHAGVTGSVVREWLLVQMQHMVAVLGSEAQEEGAVLDAEAMKEEKAEVAAALQQTRKWRRSHPREAQEERAFLRWGLWMLDRQQAEEDEEEELREGQQHHDRARRSSGNAEDEKEATGSSDAGEENAEQEEAPPSSSDGGEEDDDDDFVEVEPRGSRSLRAAAPLHSPSPSSSPPPPSHYDVDDEDEDDALLAERTTQARFEREQKQAMAMSSHQQPRARRTTTISRRKSGKGRRDMQLSSASEDDWIIEDRVEHSRKEAKSRPSASSSASFSAASAAPSRRSTRVRGAGVTTFVRQQMIAMRQERIKNASPQPYPAHAAASTVGEKEEDDEEVYAAQPRAAVAARPLGRVGAQPVRLSLSLNDLAGDDSDTTMAMDDGRHSASTTAATVPANNRQSHSMPLSILDSGGGRDDHLLLHSLPPLRHSIDVLVEGAAFTVELSALLTTSRDRLRPADLDLDLIPLPALFSLIINHVKRQTGRECALHRLVQRGEDVLADATALSLFRRQEAGQDRPLVVGVVEEWKAISPFECYTAVCSSHTPPLPRHQLIARQLHPHGVASLLTFPCTPPSTLTSCCLRALFLALRVEQATLTSLALPRIAIDADTADCLIESIEVSMFSQQPLPLRRAYIQRSPDQRLLLSAAAPSASPSSSSLPLSQLRSVQLSHAMLSSHSLSRLLLSLSLLPALTSVDASYTAVNDSCLPSLSFLAQHAQSLSSLSVHSTALTGSSTLLLTAFATALSTHSSLTSLDLGHNDWTTGSLAALLPALCSLASLSHLSLSHTSPSPSSLRLFLASLVRSSRWLRSLNLDEVDALRDAGVWADVLYLAVARERGEARAAACPLQEIRVRGGALHHDQLRMVQALHSTGTRTPFVLVD